MAETLTSKSCTPCRAGTPHSPQRRSRGTIVRPPLGRCATTVTGSSARSSSRTSAEAFAFVQRVADLAETEGHHPDVCFGWGYATVSLQTKKIKGLHENDFIVAAKLDQMGDVPGSAGQT